MRPQVLSKRIPAALALAPMTATGLAQALSSDRHAVWMKLNELQASGSVRRDGTERTHGRPHVRWSLAS